MTTIGLSYSLVKISTKCAPALGFTQAPAGLKQHGPEGDFLGLADGFQRVVWVCLIVVHGVTPAGLLVLCAGEFGLDGLIQTQHPTVITAMYAALALVIRARS